MANAFVFSASGTDARNHYRRTVEEGISIAQVASIVGQPSIASTLNAATADGKAYLWGAQEGEKNRHFFEMMVPGDLVLAYRDKSLVAAARLVATIESSELASSAWPDSTSRPYELIWFMTQPAFFQKGVQEPPLDQYFGKVYQGLRRVSGSEAILRDYGSYESFAHLVLGVDLGAPYLEPEDAVSDESSEHEPQTDSPANRVMRSIRERRGQAVFRNALRDRFGDQCVISGCKVLDVMEAAHIQPYRSEKDNDPANGLLLRSDLHTLFDLDLLGIDPTSLRVVVHPSVIQSEYQQFDGVTIAYSHLRPSEPALAARWNAFNKRLASPK